MLILRDCMSSPVISVPENATVQEAAQVMADKGVSSVLIEGQEGFAGIFTSTDLVKRVVAQRVVVHAHPATQPAIGIIEQGKGELHPCSISDGMYRP